MRASRGCMWGWAMAWLAVSVPGCGAAGPEAGPGAEASRARADVAAHSAPTHAEPRAVVLLPNQDVDARDVTGHPAEADLWQNLQPGEAGGGEERGEVRSSPGARSASYTAGFTGASSGTVVEVVATWRARASEGAHGTVQIELYDGSRLLARGAPRALSARWQVFSDTFADLSAGSVRDLRTRVVFQRSAGRGSLRLGELALRATLRPPTHRVAAFVLKDVRTCFAGHPCVSGRCVSLFSDAGVSAVSFEDDGTAVALEPGDPGLKR